MTSLLQNGTVDNFSIYKFQSMAMAGLGLFKNHVVEN